jgi:diacylglycerol kinase (ATP)
VLRFLVNPTAGGGRGGRRLRLIRRRAAELGAEVHVSCSGPDLTSQARRAVEDGVERLVVAGGDGTFHLAVQGLAESPCELALVPVGRGNDLATSVGLSARFGQALELAVSGKARVVDLGRAGRTWFASYGGVGFDSAVSRTAEGQPRWWPDSITYIVAVLRTLAGFRPPRARVEYEGGRFEGGVMFVTACNAPYFGGGMRIAPEARMDDGRLDLVIVRAISKLELLRVFPRVYRGTHIRHPGVRIHRTRWARLEFTPSALLGSDGELVERVGDEALEVTVHPGALKLVAP